MPTGTGNIVALDGLLFPCYDVINVNHLRRKLPLGNPAKPIIHHLPITKARRNLGSLVRRLHKKGEYFVLVKDGIPVAALIHPDELDDYLDMQDPEIRKAVEESEADAHAGRTVDGRELLAEIRREQQVKAGRRQRA